MDKSPLKVGRVGTGSLEKKKATGSKLEGPSNSPAFFHMPLKYVHSCLQAEMDKSPNLPIASSTSFRGCREIAKQILGCH